MITKPPVNDCYNVLDQRQAARARLLIRGC
jgi:hypothetical protein